MQEVWNFHDHTIYLICEYVNKGNYVFTAKPADLDGTDAAKAVMRASSSLRKLGMSDRSIFRTMPKILAGAPGWRLANQKVWQASDDRFRY